MQLPVLVVKNDYSFQSCLTCELEQWLPLSIQISLVAWSLLKVFPIDCVCVLQRLNWALAAACDLSQVQEGNSSFLKFWSVYQYSLHFLLFSFPSSPQNGCEIGLYQVSAPGELLTVSLSAKVGWVP